MVNNYFSNLVKIAVIAGADLRETNTYAKIYLPDHFIIIERIGCNLFIHRKTNAGKPVFYAAFHFPQNLADPILISCFDEQVRYDELITVYCHRDNALEAISYCNLYHQVSPKALQVVSSEIRYWFKIGLSEWLSELSKKITAENKDEPILRKKMFSNTITQAPAENVSPNVVKNLITPKNRYDQCRTTKEILYEAQRTR